MSRTSLASLALLAACALAAPARAERMAVFVPAYQYPTLGTLWSRLAAAAPLLPLTAIANPDNGPGNPQPTSFLATRISANADWIDSNVPEPAASTAIFGLLLAGVAAFRSWRRTIGR